MLENGKDFIQYIPFIGMVVRRDDRGSPRLTRIIESSLPGVLVAMVGIYTNDKVQDERIRNLVTIQKVEIAAMRADTMRVEAALNELRNKILTLDKEK